MFPNVARFLALILLLAVFHIPSEAQSSTISSGNSAVSDQDRLLLEKIDRLEQRIAELEAALTRAFEERDITAMGK